MSSDQPQQTFTDTELRKISQELLADAEPKRDPRRAWFITLGVVGIIAGAILVARHKYIQSYCDMVEGQLGIALDGDDQLLDVEADWGFQDRDDYFKLELSQTSYDQLFSRVAKQATTQPSMFAARWPWSVPSDAVIVQEKNEYGKTFLFSPSKRLVYVHSWTM